MRARWSEGVGRGSRSPFASGGSAKEMRSAVEGVPTELVAPAKHRSSVLVSSRRRRKEKTNRS